MDILTLLKKYGIKRIIMKGVGSVIFKMISPIQRMCILRFCPVEENKILFLSRPSFSDNSKALYLHMIAKHPENNYVWLIDDDLILPANTENVSFYKVKSFWHIGYPLKTIKEIMTSKYIFFTHNSPLENLQKRTQQFVVNLWHGCGYKDQIKRERLWIEKKKCDIALVPGVLFIESKSKCWCVGKDVIKPIGYPRYDMLLTEHKVGKKYSDKLRKDNQYLVVWMPTFRNSTAGDYPEAHMEREYDLPLLSSNEELELLNKQCSEMSITLCIKRHPSQVKYQGEKLKLSNIVFIDNKNLVNVGVELYQLLPYTDALISDYSSVSVDYLLLNKPIAFALDDYEQYKKTRGFVFENPLIYMPGHHLFSYADLLVFFKCLCSGTDEYSNKRTDLIEIMHNPCNNYCERIWHETVRLDDEKRRKVDL